VYILAKNQVIVGSYVGEDVYVAGQKSCISFNSTHYIQLNRTTVKSYIGLLSDVSERLDRTYLVALQFKDGKNSILEVDSKVYLSIVTELS